MRELEPGRVQLRRTPSRRSFAEISVRISSPAAELHVQPEPGDAHGLGGERARSRISIHALSASHTATCSNAAGSKSAFSSRFSTRSTLLLNSAVTPAASS